MKEEFVPVLREVKGNIRINSLYTFISDLRTEGKITDCTPCNNPDRNAYFFELSIDNPISLFNNGFMATSRHLAIDEIYSVSPDKTGFRLAHYTEQYEKKEDGQIIVVHAYYDQQSNISDIQVKLNGIVLQNITQDMLSQIKANAVNATKKLLALIEQKDAKYLTLYQEAAALEKELEQMLEQKNWQSFKDIAKKYNDTINSMNKYCDDKKNASHKFIQNLLATASQQAAGNVSNEESDFRDDEVVLVDTTDTKLRSKKLSIQQQKQLQLSKVQENITKKYQELLQLQQAQMQELDAIIQQHKVTKELEILQIEAWYLSGKEEVELPGPISQQQISSAASQTFDVIKQFFKEKCLQLDLNATKKVYECIKDSTFDKEYLLDLLLNLCKIIPNLKPENEPDIANILRFLFKNINIYRNILADNENLFALLFPVKRGVLASPIMLAFFSKKFKLLEIFLEYSLNLAHSTGLVYADKLIPLAKSIALFGVILPPAQFTFVMQKLFKKNQYLINNRYRHAEQPPILPIKNYCTQQEPDTIVSDLEKLLLTDDELSILELSFYDYRLLGHLEPDNVTWLAEKSSLNSLLLTLGKMLYKLDISMKIIPTCSGKVPDILVCKISDSDLIDNFCKLCINDSYEIQKISEISLILAINDKLGRTETEKNHFVNIVNRLLEVLCSKLQRVSFDVIQKQVLSMLSNNVEGEAGFINTNTKCMILLISYIRSNNQPGIKGKCFCSLFASTIFKAARYYFNNFRDEQSNAKREHYKQLTQDYCNIVIGMANYYPAMKDQYTYRNAVICLQNIREEELPAQPTIQP